jgi:hypothetical protein
LHDGTVKGCVSWRLWPALLILKLLKLWMEYVLLNYV